MTHALYGTIPSWITPPPGGVQYTPLVPGAEALEDAAEGVLCALSMLAPAGTFERRYAMALGLRALAPAAPFTILAPKDKGGTRIAAELETFGCVVAEDSKQHHRICTGVRPAMLTIKEALEEGAPRFSETLGMWTQPGVFSWDRMDVGSALLAKHLPPLRGRGADLGCGIGFLSRTVLASPDVTHLTMIDIDRRAVAMAAKNVETERTSIRWADATKDGALSALDFLVMNPPFHDGGIEDRALGQAFIRAAASALRTGGSCWLVANRHLPYEAVMQPLFARVTLIAETDGFKLYEAVK